MALWKQGGNVTVFGGIANNVAWKKIDKTVAISVDLLHHIKKKKLPQAKASGILLGFCSGFAHE